MKEGGSFGGSSHSAMQVSRLFDLDDDDGPEEEAEED